MKRKLTQVQRYAILKLREFIAGTYMTADQLGVSIHTMNALVDRGLIEEGEPHSSARFLQTAHRRFKLTPKGRGSE